MLFKKKDNDLNNAGLDMSNIPKHIGIIMDGNGRWAKKRGLPRSAGHKKGVMVLENIGDYCSQIGVKAVTAYAFSTENWSRPQKEVDYLMDLLYEYLSDAQTHFKRKNYKFMVSGDTSRFSPKLQQAIKNAIEITKDGQALILNLALNYGGRDEIVRAVKSAMQSAKDSTLAPNELTEETFSSLLDTKDLWDVDFILRPGGEKRLSNFMLWQAAYAEFIYSDKFWPDFSEKDMKAAICEYQRRTRRFGNV